jgi:hypothetical protein
MFWFIYFVDLLHNYRCHYIGKNRVTAGYTEENALKGVVA